MDRFLHNTKNIVTLSCVWNGVDLNFFQVFTQVVNSHTELLSPGCRTVKYTLQFHAIGLHHRNCSYSLHSASTIRTEQTKLAVSIIFWLNANIRKSMHHEISLYSLVIRFLENGHCPECNASHWAPFLYLRIIICLSVDYSSPASLCAGVGRTNTSRLQSFRLGDCLLQE